jgi:hypothetical protein
MNHENLQRRLKTMIYGDGTTPLGYVVRRGLSGAKEWESNLKVELRANGVEFFSFIVPSDHTEGVIVDTIHDHLVEKLDEDTEEIRVNFKHETDDDVLFGAFTRLIDISHYNYLRGTP